jgi:signal peptidase I
VSQPGKRPRDIGRTISIVLFLAVLAAIPIYLVVTYKLYKVPQKGMFPNIDAGEHIVAKRDPYDRVKDVKRGDVVIYTGEHKGSRYDFIWRVVGLPGEEIEMVDDVVIVDGERFKRERLRKEGDFAIYLERFHDASWSVALPEPQMDPKKGNMAKLKLADDELFLLGDNRHNAHDSRETGPVEFKKIIGRIVYP